MKIPYSLPRNISYLKVMCYDLCKNKVNRLFYMPSLRAKKAVKILVENRGASVSDAMRKAGYSEKTAKNPANLTKSKSWPELLQQYIPQEKVAAAHAALFEAEDVVFIPKGGKILERRRPDHTARKAAVEMGHKLHGNFAPEQLEVSKRKYQNMTNAELAALIKQRRDQLLKK